MPVNPPRPPTTREKVTRVEYETRWWIKQHQTILAYTILGVLYVMLALLIGTPIDKVGLVMTGYLAAGVFVALFQPERHA